ncbi:MAG: hypothetical protein U1D55_19285 [Phycisphaerae bacterium]
MPASRLPQINFQVQQCMKTLYEEAKANGHWVTRLCAAGLLLMIEEPQARQRALIRLRDWELDYADASEEQVRAFVLGAERAMRSGARGSRPGRAARSGRRAARAPRAE